MGMTVPEEMGGTGADTVSYALALMELAAADGALSTIVSVQNSLVATALVRYGSAAQRARFLPGLVAGTTIGAFALTEADAGSDASAIRCRATRTRQWLCPERLQAVHHFGHASPAWPWSSR